jgi:hypothetical protein
MMLAYSNHAQEPIMTSPPNGVFDSQTRWRERRRFLLATVAITLLYLGIQNLWMWGAAQLAHTGWTINDPAETYAAEAARVAAQSRQREANLDPQVPQRVFRLGYEYGYLSQWLGGYGQQTDADMEQLSRPVAEHIQRLNTLADQLGVAPASRLPVKTAADFSRLTQRLEEDPSGLAGRVEQAASPRLRHLFLFAAHVGTEAAALASPGDLTPIPATELIGKHATLASIPEPLWRPLSLVSGGTQENIRHNYTNAMIEIDKALAAKPAEARPNE